MLPSEPTSPPSNSATGPCGHSTSGTRAKRARRLAPGLPCGRHGPAPSTTRANCLSRAPSAKFRRSARPCDGSRRPFMRRRMASMCARLRRWKRPGCCMRRRGREPAVAFKAAILAALAAASADPLSGRVRTLLDAAGDSPDGQAGSLAATVKGLIRGASGLDVIAMLEDLWAHDLGGFALVFAALPPIGWTRI